MNSNTDINSLIEDTVFCFHLYNLIKIHYNYYESCTLFGLPFITCSMIIDDVAYFIYGMTSKQTYTGGGLFSGGWGGFFPYPHLGCG